MNPATIVHVITDLGAGGAERMLLRLVTRSTRFRHIVVSLTRGGALAPALRNAGIAVYELGMRRGIFSTAAMFKLARIIRRERPALVQTWLYHADLIGLLAARLAAFRPLAWNLRCSNMDLGRYRWTTRLVVKVLAGLSAQPAAVVVNSHAGQRWHETLGYRPRRWIFVPNGIDTAEFHPDAEARARWRRQLGIADDAIVIGMVARRDPMKDHETALAAAAATAHRNRNVVFVFAGDGVTRDDPAIVHLADAVGAPVHLLGECREIAALTAAFDIAMLSSAFGEGFPNVVAEAMATGVPCVVTDVGDAASIVNDTGRVVPPCSPDALAQALVALAADASLRAQLGAATRRRVLENFDLAHAVARYEAAWASLIAAEPLRRSPAAVQSEG